MRVVIVEEVVNGYVVRHRSDDGDDVALVFEGDGSLRHTIAHLTTYFLAPETPTSSPSFAMLPALKQPKPATALERKHRTPLPTLSVQARTQNEVATAKMSRKEIEDAIASSDFP
jgi:hypothetical protein